MAKVMTKDEFKKSLDDFFAWASCPPEGREEASWFVALEQWAKANFNRAYEEKYKDSAPTQ